IAAADGDTVSVAPGTYRERIDFLGKAITVESVGGRDVTVLDGGAAGSVVTILPASAGPPVFRGFTVRNGKAWDGAGIHTRGGSPLIEDNRVVGNEGCEGLGIGAEWSWATIRDNVIIGNSRLDCSGGSVGGGIKLGGTG